MGLLLAIVWSPSLLLIRHAVQKVNRTYSLYQRMSIYRIRNAVYISPSRFIRISRFWQPLQRFSVFRFKEEKKSTKEWNLAAAAKWHGYGESTARRTKWCTIEYVVRHTIYAQPGINPVAGLCREPGRSGYGFGDISTRIRSVRRRRVCTTVRSSSERLLIKSVAETRWHSLSKRETILRNSCSYFSPKTNQWASNLSECKFICQKCLYQIGVWRWMRIDTSSVWRSNKFPKAFAYINRA